jgi:lysozyme
MEYSDQLLNQELRRDEGVCYVEYCDTLGIKTTGIGHNLKAKPLPKNWKYPLNDSQVNWLFEEDLIEVFTGLDKNIPWWRDVSYKRQRVLVNMAFNLGINGLLTFKNTLQAVKSGNYVQAANGMIASKWALQVGDRAKRLSIMMVQG